MSKVLGLFLLAGVLWSVWAHADNNSFAALKEAIFGPEAGGTTAEQLVASCRYGHAEDRRRAGYQRDAWEEGSCVGYFKGFVEGLYTMGATDHIGLCIPEEFFREFRRPEAFGDPFRSIFLGWAVRHPEQLDEPAARVALAALVDAWPCRIVRTERDSESEAEAPAPSSPSPAD